MKLRSTARRRVSSFTAQTFPRRTGFLPSLGAAVRPSQRSLSTTIQRCTTGRRASAKPPRAPQRFRLLSPLVREREDIWLRLLLNAGAVAHHETRITETNTTSSCDATGGPATSPVFASALWALDWALRAPSAGVAGINFHGYFGQCAPEVFSPLCAAGRAAELRGDVSARPEYYGLAAARLLEGGRFIPVSVAGADVSGLTGYATVHPSSAITLAIDNMSGGRPISVLLRVPGYSKASIEVLKGPSLGAKSAITFGGSSFSNAGVLRSKATPVDRVSGGLRVTMTPWSAAVLTIRR